MSYDGEQHYCTGCKSLHKEWGWLKRAGKYYCRKFMYCTGCKKIHKTTPYVKMITNKDEELEYYCQKWTQRKIATPQEKAQNMSPEEVMSGVHMGLDRIGGMPKDSEDHHVEHAKEMEFLDEALEEV